MQQEWVALGQRCVNADEAALLTAWMLQGVGEAAPGSLAGSATHVTQLPSDAAP